MLVALAELMSNSACTVSATAVSGLFKMKRMVVLSFCSLDNVKVMVMSRESAITQVTCGQADTKGRCKKAEGA